MLTVVLGTVVTLKLAAVIGLVILSLTQKPRHVLGLTEGRLAPCPASPNCVSSQAERAEQRVEPFAAGGQGAEATLAELVAILERQPRCRVVVREAEYAHIECPTALFRFIDDVELVADEGAGLVHVRSGARAGHSDLGVNRKRVEALRGRLRASR